MERREIRDRSFHRTIVPGFRCAHPGYACSLYFGYLRDRLFRIEADRFGPFDQLDQGDVLLSYFYAADVGLGAAQPLGECP